MKHRPGLVETVPGGGVRRIDPEAPETRAGAGAPPEAHGVRIDASPSSFELLREYPDATSVYYRVDYGRLEWGFDLEAFLPESGPPPVPSPGILLPLLQGSAPAPDATVLPGVQRLPVGTAVRVTGQGINVTRRQPVLPEPARRGGLVEAVAEVLGGSGDYAIAYSGGLGSAFLAACALAAGHRPPLLHADLGASVHRTPAPDVPGLSLKRIRIDPSELLDEHPITGEELVPPMPDREVPRRLAAALAGARDGTGGPPLIGGTLVKELTSAKLPDVNTGVRGWRLLGCEPFHAAGTLRTLDDARTLLGKGVVYSPDAQPVGAPAPPSPTGGTALPGLTAEGAEVFQSAHRAGMAIWQELLDSLDPVLGAATAGIAECGDGGMRLPVLDPRVLATLAALKPSRLGRIRGGTFERNLPLHAALARHGITGVRRTARGHWLRRAAATHLHRERRKIIARLDRECALADLGLVDPQAVIRVLSDGRDLADNALPLLRLVWLEHWLRGGS
ncbi:hypothetical protein E1264_08385 [Actinomadura sp. KC216]|uniref:hypothetical protein n=1 Tax=Actinomadura sp. KC216 TaxID=2530370 RepID=UPI00104F8550|nr:hypothetical protein [Actinomadura sp. KC216]TDB89421.1 hypothetical protein E1264_08385 [Actinomadura sp. KC216]